MNILSINGDRIKLLKEIDNIEVELSISNTFILEK
jgi:hypothetical protein